MTPARYPPGIMVNFFQQANTSILKIKMGLSSTCISFFEMDATLSCIGMNPHALHFWVEVFSQMRQQQEHHWAETTNEGVICCFEGLGLGFRNGYYFATIDIGQISHLLASTTR